MQRTNSEYGSPYLATHHFPFPFPFPFLYLRLLMCGLCPAGGDGGHALHLQADLTAGSSEHCDTFESPPLCRGCFKIQSLEVWGIQHSLSVPPLLSE